MVDLRWTINHRTCEAEKRYTKDEDASKNMLSNDLGYWIIVLKCSDVEI